MANSRSKKLVKAHSTIRFWQERHYAALWRESRKLGFTDTQKQELNAVQNLIEQSRIKLNAIFAPEIGAAVIADRVTL